MISSMITRKDLHPFLTNSMNKTLQDERVSDEVVTQLFSEAGIQKRFDDVNVSICMRWHCDDQGRRDGVLIRMFEHGDLTIWHMHTYLWIESDGQCNVVEKGAKALKDPFLYQVHMVLFHLLFKEFFIDDERSDEAPIVFNPPKIIDSKCVNEFFRGEEPNLLPKTLLDRIYPGEEFHSKYHLENEELQDKKIQLMKDQDML